MRYTTLLEATLEARKRNARAGYVKYRVVKLEGWLAMFGWVVELIDQYDLDWRSGQ